MTQILKTPNEYIDYYSDKLKEDLKLYDLNVNYYGFIGYIMNILGWTRFDSVQYYDYLFKEAFIATADKDENLNLHGSIFQFFPTLSTPAKGVGKVVFDFNNLIQFDSNTMIKREVYFGNDSNLFFDIDKYRFFINAKYIFYQDENETKTIVTTDNNIQHIPAFNDRIEVDLINTYQYDLVEIDFSLPHYNFGEYYVYNLNIQKPFISNFNIQIKESDKNEFEQYDFSFVKFSSSGNSKTVFLKKSSSTNFILEFGSGLHGNWIPKSDVKLVLSQTYGYTGNLSTTVKNIKLNTQNTVITYYKNGNIQKDIINNLAVINFEKSEFGLDAKSGPALREEIIQHIQTRNNLINNIDFSNLYSKKFNINDFKFNFRKINPIDNTFYLYNAFRNEYMNIIPSSNKMIKTLNYNSVSSFSNLKIESIFHEDGNLIYGTEYVYLMAIGDFFGRSKTISIGMTITDSSHNAIKITWDDHSHITKIFGRSDEFYIYEWSLSNNVFIDIGNNNTFINNLNINIQNDSLSKLPIDIYEYKIQAVFANNIYTELQTFSQISITEPSSITLHWSNNLSNVLYYRIFRKSSSTITMWTVVDTTFIDSGVSVNSKLVSYNNKNKLVSQQSKYNDIIYKPIFENMISPFIYKYNKFLNKYDGFFEYDLFLIYFKEIKIKTENYILPNIYMQLQYDPNLNKTLFYIKSYQPINHINFKLTIEHYNIFNKSINYINDTTQVFWVDGLLTDSMIIKITNDNDDFILTTGSFKHVIDISDILSLFIYDLNNETKYIMSIPVISKEIYDSEPNLYLSKFYSIISDNIIPFNRMQTDHIQLRFLETNFIDKYYTERILKQHYNTDILFPLKMKISISYNINHSDFYLVDLISEQNEILEEISVFLNEKATGTDILIYPSQIIDLIHSKRNYIKSVNVIFLDQNNFNFVNGIETYSDQKIYENIIDYDNQLYYNHEIALNAKFQLLKYNPVYWYWDYDNIDININT